MKKTLLSLAIVAALGISQAAHATPVTTTFADTSVNWATWSSTNNIEVDPLGHPDFASTSVTQDGTQLQKIVFNYDAPTTYTDSWILKSGDLFIDADADKDWDYVVKAIGSDLNDAANPVITATLALYQIDVALHSTTAYAYSSYRYVFDNTTMSTTATNYRAGLPVGLLSAETSNLTSLMTVNYKANVDGIEFNFGQNSLLNFDKPFIIGYGVTCGNDEIYQNTAVPEPGTFALLGAGLLGLGLFARRKRQL